MIILLIGIFQAIIIEFGTTAVMQTVALNWYQWLVSMALGMTVFPVGFVLRLIPTHDPSIVSDEEWQKNFSDEAVIRNRMAKKGDSSLTVREPSKGAGGSPISLSSSAEATPAVGHTSGGTVTITVGQGPNSH